MQNDTSCGLLVLQLMLFTKLLKKHVGHVYCGRQEASFCTLQILQKWFHPPPPPFVVVFFLVRFFTFVNFCTEDEPSWYGQNEEDSPHSQNWSAVSWLCSRVFMSFWLDLILYSIERRISSKSSVKGALEPCLIFQLHLLAAAGFIQW